MGSEHGQIVALVPARGGSKGIPGKNIRSLCGKPLLYWVCKAAEDCAAIAATYVATDDEAIAATARGLGLSKVRVIGRAPETATDTASTESVLLDFANRLDFENLALLQATSPLLRTEDLDQGAALLAQPDCDSVLSTVRQTRFRWRMTEDGTVAPENYNPRQRPRRQDCEGFLVENGAFYMTSRAALLESQCRLSGKIKTVTMPEDTYFELDDSADWTILEGLLARRFRISKTSLDRRLRGLKLVASDIDGCLTDSGMYYAETGGELKKFNTRDGKGFQLLREAGLCTALITLENTEMNARRAAKLQIPEVHQGAHDKVAVMEDILERHGWNWEEVAYLGDDVGDYALLQQVGVSACPADAIDAVRDIVDLPLRHLGGAGAFREFADRILQAKAAL